MLPLCGMSGSSAGQPPGVRPDWVRLGGPSLAINTWILFKEALAFTPWWMLNYIWCDTGVFLLVFFLLIFRRLLEPQTGVVGAQSLRIV